METEVKAAMTICAFGMQDYLKQVKNAEKLGWKCEGNPDVAGGYIYQLLVKEE